MKTVTFYSYKGGVGRSLALSNIATRLSELGQKVCIIDFDLEAPGLNFKFKKHRLNKNIEVGIVDYIYKFSVDNELPKNILDYSLELEPGNANFHPITLIPAGNIFEGEYWRKLSKINWDTLFYDKDAQGVQFFMDLKSKIHSEIDPDFLLIDSRTGITDIAGLTLKIFADQAIILGVNNEENIFGSKKIISALLNTEKNFSGRDIKINFVWARCPYNTDEKEKELVVLDKLRSDFYKTFLQEPIEFSVIHADKLLEREEAHLSASNYEYLTGSVSSDYFGLLESIVEGKIDLNDKIILKKRAEGHFHKGLEEQKTEIKFKHINKAISLDPSNFVYYIQRGLLCITLGNYQEAKNDFRKARELNQNEQFTPYYRAFLEVREKNYDMALQMLDEISRPLSEIELDLKGIIFSRINRVEEAIGIFTKVLDLNPVFHRALNNRANAFRKIGKFENALDDVKQAIQLVSGQSGQAHEAIYYGTMAEIYFSAGDRENFYFNIRLAFNKGLKTEHMEDPVDVYAQLTDDEEFLSILSDYDVSISDLVPGFNI